ncbi:unnamed protein product [Rhizophagus irregularis]|nr:unnamed protein product [Rhizophagus irregularis]CAB5182643.1 unnamed protein product [Rhizophagus irregularis]
MSFKIRPSAGRASYIEAIGTITIKVTRTAKMLNNELIITFSFLYVTLLYEDHTDIGRSQASPSIRPDSDVIQSQILALNEAIRQEKASSSIDCNNPVAISPDYATSTSIPPTPIRASKPSNRWTSTEIRILIKEVGEHQQALQKVKDPREKGRIWDNIVSNIQSSNVASPVLKERSKASIQQKWDTVFQKYREYFL